MRRQAAFMRGSTRPAWQRPLPLQLAALLRIAHTACKWTGISMAWLLEAWELVGFGAVCCVPTPYASCSLHTCLRATIVVGMLP